MAIDFPNSPTTGDTFSVGSKTWKWNGSLWVAVSSKLRWAYVTATTGTPTTGTYTDANGVSWKYYKWTGNGSVTTSGGVVDCLLVGGGGHSDGWSESGSGFVRDGVQQISAGTLTITIGQPGASGVLGTASSLGSISAGRGSSAVAQDGKAGRADVTSSITGTSLTYGSVLASVRANFGDGGENAGPGSSGVVIIRVPVEYALV